MSDDAPKIIIDEGWKKEVEREKQDLEAPASGEQADPAETAGGPHAANFEAIVANLVTQAMFALGIMGDPDTQEVVISLEEAKFVIDSLGVLLEKTRGNLTPEEEEHLKASTAELQRFYLVRVQQFDEQNAQAPGIPPIALQ